MDFFQRTSVYLVVDGFEVMRQITTKQLQTLGVDTILTATNGIEALNILRKEHVDLVLSDLKMPTMSGLELLKVIRADKHLIRLPFLMITAEFDRKMILEVINAGTNGILFKPYTTQRLTEYIQKTLSFQQPRAEPLLSQASAMLTAQPVISTTKSESASHFAKSVSSFPDLTLQNDSRLLILIVDNDVASQLLLLKMFNNDYLVRTVSSGEMALTICRSDTPPDLVLLDIMMPGMDGFEVALHMREYPGSTNIPIIFVTAKNDHETLLKCMSLGAVDFVTKPIDLGVMRLRVSNFMHHLTLHKQLQTAYDDVLKQSRIRDMVDQITRNDLR
jgi:CheY-like chemotaxis protein